MRTLNNTEWGGRACMPVLHYGDEMTVIPFDGVFVLLGVFDDGERIPIAESEAPGSVLLESCFQISPGFTNECSLFHIRMVSCRLQLSCGLDACLSRPGRNSIRIRSY